MKNDDNFLALLNSIDFESKIELEPIDHLKSISNRISAHILKIKTRIKLINSAIVIFGFAFILTNTYFSFYSFKIQEIISSSENVLAFFVMILSFSWASVLGIWLSGKYEIKLTYVDRIIRRLQRHNIEKKEKIVKDYIDQLMEINNENISDYYQQVRKNSNNLLICAIVIGLIGFFFVFISLIISSITSNNKDIIYISSITGILLDSFAGFFFMQYGSSSKNMKSYYDGLLSTQHKLIDKKMEKI